MNRSNSFYCIIIIQIYLITLKSGEMYIGQHRGDIFEDEYYGSPRGKNGYNRFSKDDVADRIVLQETHSKEKADILEALYIRKYRDKYGCVKRVLDEYPRLKLLYPEGKMLNVSAGNNYEDFERSNKIINDNMDTVVKAIGPKTRGHKKKVKKKVRQLSLNRESLGVYKNVLEASLTTGIASQSILACCHGKQKTAGSYIWEFAS